jgi:hypothetical protein
MTDKELDEIVDRVSNALDVPEPSPLFWEHFPGRVRAAVDAAPAVHSAWWRRPVLAYALSAALVGSMSYVAWTNRVGVPAVTVDNQVADTTAVDTATLEGLEDTEDPGWEVVTSVAESAGIETLHEAGFGVAPGSADAAIEAMTDAERAQLVALLRAEMTGDASGG